VYDEQDGRFVFGVIDTDRILNSTRAPRLLVAVSKSELPDSASTWNFLAFNSSITVRSLPTFPDYIGLKVDDKVIYVTSSLFTYQTPTVLIGSRLWVIDKGVIGGFYSGASPIVRGPYDIFQEAGGTPRTALPAQMHGSSAARGSIGTFVASIEYFVSSYVLNIFTISNPLGNIVFTRTSFVVGLLSQNIGRSNVPQLGTTTPLEVLTSRVNDVVWRDNKLWVTLTVTPPDPNRATSYWFRIDTTGGIITIEAPGSLFGTSFSAGTHTFFPAVEINQKGEVAFGYGASSPTMYAGAYGSLLLGTNELPFVVKRGQDYFVRTDENVNGWGSFSSISVDPNDNSFWIFNQFADTRGTVNSTTGEDGRWGTAWARVYCNATVCIACTLIFYIFDENGIDRFIDFVAPFVLLGFN
jgi:hypothetical protein